MLKKFSTFWHQDALVLPFSPFLKTVGGIKLQFIQASDENIPDLLTLESEVYSGHTPWSSFSFKTELQKRVNSLYLVVYTGSTLVAFIGARFRSNETHITNIAVKPSFQKKGIGTFLLQLMIDRARCNRCPKLTLEVRVDNINAQIVYRKLGFRANLVRKNYYVSDQVDALNMVLTLTETGKGEAK